jgi:hypothetical protein
MAYYLRGVYHWRVSLGCVAEKFLKDVIMECFSGVWLRNGFDRAGSHEMTRERRPDTRRMQTPWNFNQDQKSRDGS